MKRLNILTLAERLYQRKQYDSKPYYNMEELRLIFKSHGVELYGHMGFDIGIMPVKEKYHIKVFQKPKSKPYFQSCGGYIDRLYGYVWEYKFAQWNVTMLDSGILICQGETIKETIDKLNSLADDIAVKCSEKQYKMAIWELNEYKRNVEHYNIPKMRKPK